MAEVVQIHQLDCGGYSVSVELYTVSSGLTAMDARNIKIAIDTSIGRAVPKELLNKLFPYIKIDELDDNMATYRCLVDCRPKIDLNSPEALYDHCYHKGFPHTNECELKKMVDEAAKTKM